MTALSLPRPTYTLRAKKEEEDGCVGVGDLAVLHIWICLCKHTVLRTRTHHPQSPTQNIPGPAIALRQSRHRVRVALSVAVAALSIARVSAQGLGLRSVVQTLGTSGADLCLGGMGGVNR